MKALKHSFVVSTNNTLHQFKLSLCANPMSESFYCFIHLKKNSHIEIVFYEDADLRNVSRLKLNSLKR